MKWIQAATLLALVVVLALVWMFYMKMTSLDQRMKNVPNTDDINQRLEAMERKQFELHDAMLKALAGVLDRVDAIEAGTSERTLRGPMTPDFLLSDLERLIHLKRDAALMPDKERQEQEKIEKTIQELEQMQQEGADIVSSILERVRVQRDPEIQVVLIRDVVWRLGPETVPGLMALFRDQEFPGNLRVLSAISAIKVTPDKQAMLKEFTEHLEDPKEFLVVKTGLVREVFNKHRYEDAVEWLILGAKSIEYHQTYRIACLQALGNYDHPRVLRALEEIINSGEDAVFVVNLSIDAYQRLMREDCKPFLEKILKEGKLDDTNREKIKDILKKY